MSTTPDPTYLTRSQVLSIVAEEITRARQRHPALELVPVRWNGRLRRALGRAKFKLGAIVCIELASAIRWTEAALRDVVRHEYAHVLAGVEAGHGPVWQHYARQLGANPGRACALPVDTGRRTFTIACLECGATIGTMERHRRPTRWVEARRHSRCGGRLEIVE